MNTTPGKNTIIDLRIRLLRETHRFDFFQVVRLFDRLVREDYATPPEPLGRDSNPQREAVRFRSYPSLSFPAGAVTQARYNTDNRNTQNKDNNEPIEVVVSFLGLTGSVGVLPHHYTTLLLERLRAKDLALRDFLDLFNHRLISLFYRAWEKYRLPFAYERAQLLGAPAGQGDPASEGLYCLAGFGTQGLRGRLQVADQAFLYYSGHFAHFPRSASALEALLRDYFGLPIQVCQLHGRWLILSPEERTGPNPEGGWRNNELGSVIVGARIWDVQSQFRLRVGPIGYVDFLRLMPNGDQLRPLCELTRSYVGPELEFDIQLVLKSTEVPRCQLGGTSLLGWNTWIFSEAMGRDAEEAVFALPQV